MSHHSLLGRRRRLKARESDVRATMLALNCSYRGPVPSVSHGSAAGVLDPSRCVSLCVGNTATMLQSEEQNDFPERACPFEKDAPLLLLFDCRVMDAKALIAGHGLPTCVHHPI